MVDVRSKQCSYEGCPREQSYEVADTEHADFCAHHAEDGMMDVLSESYTGGLPKVLLVWVGKNQKTRVLRTACKGRHGECRIIEMLPAGLLYSIVGIGGQNNAGVICKPFRGRDD